MDSAVGEGAAESEDGVLPSSTDVRASWSSSCVKSLELAQTDRRAL